MTSLSNIIVNGGLMQRAAEDYNDRTEQRALDSKNRALAGRKTDAEASMLDQDTALKQLRQQIEDTELRFKQSQQPGEQALKQSDLAHRQAMQPGAQANERAAQGIVSGQQQVQQGEIDAAKKLLPGKTQLAGAEQQAALQDVKQRQAANVWSLIKLGDTDGALAALSNSEILFPGRKFKSIVRGAAPVRGQDGQPMMGADGKPVMEPMVQLVPDDGKEPMFIPEKSLDALATKYNTRTEKVGKSLVRLNPDGSVNPLYVEDEYKAAPETGAIYSGRTGMPPPAAAGGIGGGQPPSRKETAAIDDRVKMAIDKVILPKFGGKFEGGMFFPDEANKDVALRASKLSEQFIRNEGMDPVAAATKAVEQAEREKAVQDAAKSGGGAGAKPYAGPTPWKR